MKMYTCPMHPDVQEEKEGSCPKCGMTLVPAKETQEKPSEEKSAYRKELNSLRI